MKKKVSKKMGKQVSGKKYAADLERYEDKKSIYSDNHPMSKPMDIADALERSKKKQGYSKKPRVKPNRVGKGK